MNADTVAACRELTWAVMERRGVRRDDPDSSSPLVQGIEDMPGEPLLGAYTAPALTADYDELVGPGHWERAVRSADLGQTVVVRFAAEDERAHCGSPTPTGNRRDGARAGFRRAVAARGR